MIGETGGRKSAVATPDGKSRKKKKKNNDSFFDTLNIILSIFNFVFNPNHLEIECKVVIHFNFYKTW